MNFFQIESRRQSTAMLNHHFHNSYEIYYLVSGERNYFINDRIYHLNQGDLVFIDKNELHKTGYTVDPQHERILINFTEQLIHCFQTENIEIEALLFPFHSHFRLLSPKGNDQILVQGLLSAILHEQDQQFLSWTLNGIALITQLLIHCGRLMRDEKREDIEHSDPLSAKIAEITNYINTNYKAHLTLPSVAATFYLSPSYLSRSYKRITGFSFMEYVNHVRIREAKRLLGESDLKVIQVAEQSGFQSISHFGRVFKQVTRLSPLTYRKMNAKLV